MNAPRPKVSAGLFAFVIVFFFLPFVRVSCAGQKVMSVTGIKLATGGSFEDPGGMGGRSVEKLEPDPFAILALVAAVGGVVLSLAARSAIASAILGGAGAVFLLILKSRLADRTAQESMGVVQVEMDIGYWLAMLFFVGAAAVNFMLGRQSSSSSSNSA